MSEGKSRFETILTIVGSVMTIVTGWFAFAGALRNASRWMRSHFLSPWTFLILSVALLLALLVFVLVKKNQRCGDAWESVKNALKHLRTIWTLIIALIVLIVISVAVIIYRHWTTPTTKTISGTVFYKRCPDSQGLNPAPNVIVWLSDLPDMRSPATSADGKFVISGIPIDFEVKNLTMKTGDLYYPGNQYRLTQDYEVIPVPCSELDLREITDPWTEARGAECLTESDDQPAMRKVFVLDTTLPGEEGKKEAFVTVERQAPEIVLLNVFVLLPTTESDPDRSLYRNAMDGVDKKEKHRWVFTLPKKGLRIKLEVCLGAADSSVELSPKRLHTYYQLQ